MPSALKRLPRLLSLVLLFLLVTGSARALEIPERPTAWVTDRGAILDDSQELQLNQKLEAFYKRSGSQILVFTFPSLEGEALEDYTSRVADKWKTKGDRALIFFVFVQDHKARIEVGYGLEGSITDAVSSDILRNVIAPAFRQNDYFGGLNSALDHLIAIIEGKEKPIAPDLSSGGGAGGPQQLTSRDIILFVIILFVIIFFVLPLLRSRGCGGCGCFPMFPFGGGGTTWGGGGGGWGGGGGSSFGGGGASGSW